MYSGKVFAKRHGKELLSNGSEATADRADLISLVKDRVTRTRLIGEGGVV